MATVARLEDGNINFPQLREEALRLASEYADAKQQKRDVDDRVREIYRDLGCLEWLSTFILPTFAQTRNAGRYTDEYARQREVRARLWDLKVDISAHTKVMRASLEEQVRSDKSHAGKLLCLREFWVTLAKNCREAETLGNRFQRDVRVAGPEKKAHITSRFHSAFIPLICSIDSLAKEHNEKSTSFEMPQSFGEDLYQLVLPLDDTLRDSLPLFKLQNAHFRASRDPFNGSLGSIVRKVQDISSRISTLEFRARSDIEEALGSIYPTHFKGVKVGVFPVVRSIYVPHLI